MPEIKTAVIPAAGFGVRFLPATMEVPKEMLCVVDRPIIHHVVDEAMKSGIENFIVIGGRGKESLTRYFNIHPELEQHLERKNNTEELKNVKAIGDLSDRFTFVTQKEPKGLGHAISCAKKAVQNESAFTVLLGDTIYSSDNIPVTKQCIEAFKKYGKPIIAVEKVKKDDVNRYGIVGMEPITGSIGKVTKFVEKPSPETAPTFNGEFYGITGTYILTPSIFEHLEKVQPGTGGEIQLTDALAELSKQTDIYYLIIDGERFDVSNPTELVKVSLRLAMKDKKMRSEILNLLSDLKLTS
ncbi:MAG: UTP--glucose-1-phosphate uridylyltransferase [Candidatus Aenigmarchaeota archaeon]|nr:UTP--glucose-1-phosphate uridylyltransferase [Candidatus Aenigmarchaeota archaeon]